MLDNNEIKFLNEFETFSKDPIITNKYDHFNSTYLSVKISLSETNLPYLINFYKMLNEFKNDDYLLGTIQYLTNDSHYINILELNNLQLLFISTESIERNKKIIKLNSINREILRSKFENLSFEKSDILDDIIESAFDDSQVLECIEGFSFTPYFSIDKRRLCVNFKPHCLFENFISVLEFFFNMKKRLDVYKIHIIGILCDPCISPGRMSDKLVSKENIQKLSYGDYRKSIFIDFQI